MDLATLLTPEAITVFFEILMIDIVLAGDNAIVVGALAAGLPADQRKKVILIGVIAALREAANNEKGLRHVDRALLGRPYNEPQDCWMADSSH